MKEKVEKTVLDIAGKILNELDFNSKSTSSVSFDLYKQSAIAIIATHLEMFATIRTEAVKRELMELQIKCGLCICGEEGTDECCPVCIPNEQRGNVFEQLNAALAFARKIDRVANSYEFISVFHIAGIHHAQYAGENWKDEKLELERQLGEQLNK